MAAGTLGAERGTAALLFSVCSSVPVGLSRGTVQVKASVSPRSRPPAKVPSTPPTLVRLQLPTSESKWSRVGADKGAEEDRRSRHPLP